MRIRQGSCTPWLDNYPHLFAREGVYRHGPRKRARLRLILTSARAVKVAPACAHPHVLLYGLLLHMSYIVGGQAEKKSTISCVWVRSCQSLRPRRKVQFLSATSHHLSSVISRQPSGGIICHRVQKLQPSRKNGILWLHSYCDRPPPRPSHLAE